MLSCSGRFFLSWTRLDASNGISASLSSLHDSDAGRYGRCSGERLEIRLRGGGKCSLSPKRHAFSPGGPDFSTAEYYDRSCARMQRHSIELGSLDDQHPGRQFILEDPVATHCACRIHHSARHLAEWFPHPCDCPSLRERRSADDSQRNPPPRRTAVFCAFASAVAAPVSVAAQG